MAFEEQTKLIFLLIFLILENGFLMWFQYLQHFIWDYTLSSIYFFALKEPLLRVCGIACETATPQFIFVNRLENYIFKY